MRIFYLNALRNKTKDFQMEGTAMNVILSGVHDLEKTTAMVMDKETLREAKKILRSESKPLITAMRANINKSKKKITATLHRHYSKKKVTTLTRTHKPGQLKRSIAFIPSKKFKDLPVGYVGNRKGVNTPNDGWYGHFTEFGTDRGIQPQRWFQRAIDKLGRKIQANVANKIFAAIGKKMEKGR